MSTNDPHHLCQLYCPIMVLHINNMLLPNYGTSHNTCYCPITVIVIIINPLNRECRWGITDDFATSFLHFSLFSTALWDLPNSRPVHSLMLSSHLFLFCLVFLPLSLCLARWFWHDLMNVKHDLTLQFVSLYDRQEVFMWSNSLLDLGKDFLVGNMVFV